MKRLSLIIFLIMAFTSCASYDVENILNDVDSYIMERPDSALLVLESIKREELKSERIKAHHALLYSMALDKNYIDVKDDSIAMVAVNYYSKHGSGKNKARAYYYLGNVYYYRKEYDRAIVEFSKAEELAEIYDSLYWGMTKDAQAHSHQANYNEVESLNCFLKAYEIFSGLSDFNRTQSVKANLASVYTSQFEYTKAENLLVELLNTDGLKESTRINSLCYYAYLKVIKPDSELDDAVKLYDKVVEYNNMMIQDYWAYAYALNQIGRMEESEKFIEHLTAIDTTTTASYWLYRISKKNGDLASALSYLEESNFKDNEVITEALSQSLSIVQRDYYESQSEILGLKAKNRTLISLSLILFISLMVITFIIYVKRQNEEKDRYIQYAEEVSRQLKHYKEDVYSLLQKKYISLYKSRYETIGILFEQYTNSTGRIDAERQIYKKVVSLIDELRNEIDNGEGFENILNADLDGIMDKLRREVPKLNKKDCILFGYFSLGFDPTIISHFMNTSINTIYIRKSRMKKSIEESRAAHKSEFLEILS